MSSNVTDLDGFTIGMAMTNLGGEMKLEGRDLLTSTGDEPAAEYQVSSWPLPLTFHLGFGWKLMGSEEAFRINEDHGVAIVFDGRHINEGFTHWRTGFQYDFRELIFLRMGRVFNHDTEDWSFGAGLNIPLPGIFVSTDIGYADLGDLDAVKRISIRISGR